jgi:hypothetical protein
MRSRLFLSSLVRLTYGAYERGHRDPERYYTNRSSEPYRVTQQILKNFRDEALQNGAGRVVVLVLPDASDISDYRSGQPLYWTAFTEELSAVGMEVLDATPFLARAAHDEKTRILFNRFHYSARGNRAVEWALANKLR